MFQVLILTHSFSFGYCKQNNPNLIFFFLFSARADNEFSDSEDEGEGGRRDNRVYNRKKRPRLETPATGSDAEVKDEKDSKSKYFSSAKYLMQWKSSSINDPFLFVL